MQPTKEIRILKAANRDNFQKEKRQKERTSTEPAEKQGRFSTSWDRDQDDLDAKSSDGGDLDQNMRKTTPAIPAVMKT